MSNKPGTAANVISLPKGGGAIQGIGETFSPDLFSGTGNFTVPIAIPPGRNGFQPEVNLVYSTGNGNSPFGLGWKLTIPNVSRKTSKGIPQYVDDVESQPNSDTFLLSGAEDLVLVSDAGVLPARFKPRTEGLFAIIEHLKDDRSDFWRVQSKNGFISTYGTPGSVNNDPAVVAHPQQREKVFSWELTQTIDTYGNRIDYSYLRDLREEGSRSWDQLYLDTIQYIDLEDGGEKRFLVSIKFIYEERPDAFSQYRSGFEIRTRLRCQRIEIKTHSAGDILIKTYELFYMDKQVETGEIPASSLPLNGVSLLSRISIIGQDGEDTQELPPLDFSYSTFNPAKKRFTSFEAESDAMPTKSLASDDIEMIDLFGNGLPDIVELNGSLQFWRNLGNGKFAFPQPLDEVPAGVELKDPNVRFADLNGNGRADLLTLKRGEDGEDGYFPMSFKGRWSREGFFAYDKAPSFDLNSQDVRFIDLEGDGVTDALQISDRVVLFFNDDRQGWTGVEDRPRNSFEGFPDLNFSDQRVKLADMTGDGLQDMVLVSADHVIYWPYLGYGRWGKAITMDLLPAINDPLEPNEPHFSPERLLLGDLDGDGLDDVIYVESSKVTVWINQSGNHFSEPITINSTPDLTRPDAVRVADMLSLGAHGLLWTRDKTVPGEKNFEFLDLTGGEKPYLLTEMNNNMGATTRVQYAPSTKFYLADQENTKTAWKTPLPFPVHVVERVEVIDELSKGKLTAEYRYHHGYWDGSEREFRGFGQVEQMDSERFGDFNAAGLHGSALPFERVEQPHFSPPTLSKTWFHLGALDDETLEGNADGKLPEIDFSDEYFEDDPSLLPRPQDQVEFLHTLPLKIQREALRTLRGSVLRTELYVLDGSTRPFTVTESLAGLSEVEEPTDPESERKRIFFPHSLAQRTTKWERGNDPMTSFTFTDDYDTFGQPRRQTQIACPRGWRSLEDTPTEQYLATHSRTEYASPPQDSNLFLVDRVARSTSFEIVNNNSQTIQALRGAANSGSALRVIGQSLNFYDGAAFTGLPNGVIGEHGALVRTESLVLTEDILKEAYKHDGAPSGTPEIPPYLNPAGSPSWSPEYPPEFRRHIERLPPLAGFAFNAGDEIHEKGYFATSTQNAFDFQVPGSAKPRGLLRTLRNPLSRDGALGGQGSHDTTIDYDPFDLLPIRVTDPVGLVIEVRYDQRLLQPVEVIDPNGNRTHYAYTPLGLLQEIAVLGKEGEFAGDEENLPGGIHEVPSTRFEYDFLAFLNSSADKRIPISVHTIQLVHHISETDVTDGDERNKTSETVEYSDGFGRLLQTRTLAEDDTVGHPIFGGSVLSADQAVDSGEVVLRARATNTGPNVVVSGAQVYDNKGRVVEKFEPYFELDSGFDYRPPGEDRFGQQISMFYDPLGRVTRTLNPDGSEQRVIHGVPGSILTPDLTTPDLFEPTPWEAYSYDANDLAPISREHQADGSPGPQLTEHAPRHHHFTPSSILVDALGRTVLTVARNRQVPERSDAPLPPIEAIETRSVYDIRGNVLKVMDAQQREAFTYMYDLANNTLRTENIDAGVRRVVLDGAGNEIERRDSKGAVILQAYDQLLRPIRLWARDDDKSDVTLRERLEYGDGGDPNQDRSVRDDNRVRNRLGALYRHYDEAGLLELSAYDFKGNVLEKSRRMIRDEAILAVFQNRDNPDQHIRAFRVNWDPLEEQEQALLADEAYETSATYDALNRVKRLLYPRDVKDDRKELRPTYNRAGAVESVTMDGKVFIEHIAYDAKGQRTFVALGNRVMTLYAYEPRTFRLSRMVSTLFSDNGGRTFRPEPLTTPEARKENLHQDFGYDYDLAGNIVRLRDRTPESGILNTRLGRNALDRTFAYDAIYRLTSATGREADRPPEHRPDEPFDPSPRATDLTRTRAYRERYRYDVLGNLEELNHSGFNGRSNTNTFVRRFTHRPGTNQLARMTAGEVTFTYAYDQNGNMTDESTTRHFEWDHSNQMKVFRTQVEGTEPSLHAHYLYDASGQRVKKLVRKQNGFTEVTEYMDGLFEHHRWQRNGKEEENNRLHVMDDQQRVAIVRVGDPHPEDRGPEVQYQLSDHLGSSNVVISAEGAFITHEEYTPYGETSFGSFAKKCYRFTGKERDEESGLYYYGARYYAPWLSRWVSCDPINNLTRGFKGDYALLIYPSNLYNGFALNPIRYVDPDGRQPELPKGNLWIRLVNRGRGVILALQFFNFEKTEGGRIYINPEVDSEAEVRKEATREANSLKRAQAKNRGAGSSPPDPPDEGNKPKRGPNVLRRRPDGTTTNALKTPGQRGFATPTTMAGTALGVVSLSLTYFQIASQETLAGQAKETLTIGGGLAGAALGMKIGAWAGPKGMALGAVLGGAIGETGMRTLIGAGEGVVDRLTGRTERLFSEELIEQIRGKKSISQESQTSNPIEVSIPTRKVDELLPLNRFPIDPKSGMFTIGHF